MTKVNTSAIKRRKIQVHFEVPDEMWSQFRRKLSNLGYSTASEFLRERIREALPEEMSVKPLNEAHRKDHARTSWKSETRNMKEFVYDYDEFKQKVSTVEPIHHSCMGRYIDKEGIIYELTFRIYGVSKKGGRIVIFETKRRLDTLSKEFNEKWSKGNFHDRLNEAIKTTLGELEKTCATRIGSTEGRLEL